MDLILWRHAEAGEHLEGANDLLRPLTARGEKQAARMASWLDRQLPEGARVLSSPATRCEQTAQALGRKYKRMPELAPGATPEQLLAAVQWPEGKGTVLVVGHQPTLGQVLAQLLGLQEDRCAVKKGAAWWLRVREREGRMETVVVAVQPPDFA